MKHLILSLIVLLGSLSAVAATTYDFSTSIPKGWTASVAPQGYDTRGTQFTQNATLTLSGVSDVTEVTIVASCNYDKAPNTYTLSVAVGSKSFGSYTLEKVTNETFTFSGAAASGDLVVTITRNGKKSLWVKSITVEGTVPAQQDPADRLDKDYIYPADPVMILPKDSLGKMEIDTVINNILLSCASGAFYKTDIRVMASSAITFTATKPIKAIRIDGGNRKAFSATASAGTLTYAVDYEADIENAEPVLLIKDINESSVKLTCDKQLQMQKIYIYFDANPDVEIDTDDEVVPVESCNVSSTGEWNFVASYTNKEFLWTVGTVAITLISNSEWQFYSDAYPYGEGSGMYLYLDFYPDDILYDWSGTYTIADGTLTSSSFGYNYIAGEVEGDDLYETYVFVDGSSITVTANEETYDISYSLVALQESETTTYTGTINGVCREPGKPMAIDLIEVPLDINAPMYNILGQPVDANYNGIIIQNNHKYLKTRL